LFKSSFEKQLDERLNSILLKGPVDSAKVLLRCRNFGVLPAKYFTENEEKDAENQIEILQRDIKRLEAELCMKKSRLREISRKFDDGKADNLPWNKEKT